MLTRWKICFLLVLVMAASAHIGAFAQSAGECPRDPAEFAAVQQRANPPTNDPLAQTALAFCYDLGRNVQPSRKENMRWLELAANQNYAPAEYELGRIYLYGRGVPADFAKALVWEQEAAEQGDSRAQRDLAFMYERGFGVTADPAQAAEWNRKAAAQGRADAQFHLAKALDEGSGVKKDPAEARKWYSKAARQNSAAAQLQLARNYAQAVDCAPAFQWYRAAAAGGEAQAMYELGMLHLKGKPNLNDRHTCLTDATTAFQWFTIGARFGSQESKAAADKLAPSLSAAQKQSAELAAERWIKQHSGIQKEEDEEERDERK